ncbi:MAG: molybdopterin-binding protein [Anaerolineae bacterium]|nr:molybdopterin-binding protein [Anaerolineae bacterium]
MKFGEVPLAAAVGHVLAHNLFGTDGHKLFSKGHVLIQADVIKLVASGWSSVVVAALDATDLSENEAARRVGIALAGPNVRIDAPGVGRANLSAEVAGPLRINVPALERINNIDEGITVATLREHTLVQPRQLLTLVKIIPFGIAAARVADVEAVAREAGPIITVRALQPRSVALILSGPAHAQDRLQADFIDPVRTRVEGWGSQLDEVLCVEHTESALAEAIQQAYETSHDLILLAGISAIIDRDDVAPQALRDAGGNVAHFGVPVDPGSLLMLGYIGDTPVIGAPGCIKSLKTNVIDWVLPRLLAGERLTRADLVVMGHGGLLDDISERPMPRQST